MEAVLLIFFRVFKLKAQYSILLMESIIFWTLKVLLTKVLKVLTPVKQK